jgi:hypothetical protein
MSKSIKRNNKYSSFDDYDYEDDVVDHREKLKEKRMKAALRSRNKNAIFDLIEEDY